MGEYNITPFLYEEDETLRFLYEECEKVYDNVLSSIPETDGLMRDAGVDPVDLLGRMDSGGRGSD